MEDAEALKDVFEACRRGCEDLEQGPSKVTEEKKLDFKGKILACMKMVDTLALFSDNEDKDDIMTSHLKFLLLPFFLGLYHMYSNSQTTPPTQRQREEQNTGAGPARQAVDTLSRLEHVQEALLCFRAFLEQCAMKDVLEDKVKKLAERICLDASTNGEPGEGVQQRPLPSATNFGREEKIALYRRQKELKAAMETLRTLEDDEENARSLALLEINNCAMSACQHYASLEKEVEILQFAREHRDSLPRMNEERERATGQEKMKMFESLKNTAAALQADRERFAQGVFKPSHILPTMTVEEFGMLELERMKQREEAQRQHQQKTNHGKAKCCSDDDHSEDEQCLKKAREWDDFKDDNPFGSGNKNLRPCA